jgi:hypothetical protein
MHFGPNIGVGDKGGEVKTRERRHIVTQAPNQAPSQRERGMRWPYLPLCPKIEAIFNWNSFYYAEH